MSRTSAFLVLPALCLAAPLVSAQCFSSPVYPADVSPNDSFGEEIAASGNDLVVAARRDDDMGIDHGSVYAYQVTPSGLVELQELYQSDPTAGSGFGEAVAVAGDWIAVGAPRAFSTGPVFPGAVYLYPRTGPTSWEETAIKITPFDEAVTGEFGSAVDLDVGVVPVLAVGATWDDTQAFNAGAVYVYTYDAGSDTWSLDEKLTPFDGAASDDFGFSVSLDGNRLAVGAARADTGAVDEGAVYLYQRTGGGWVFDGKIEAPGDDAAAFFGIDLELSGNRVIVGARFGDGAVEDSGTAYVFRRDGAATWTLEATFFDPEGEQDDDFGNAVALEGTRAMVGSQRFSAARGKVTYYERSGGAWNVLSTQVGPTPGEWFACSVALAFPHAHAGAFLWDDFLFQGGAVFTASFEGPDCNGNGVADACDISSGTSLDGNGNGVPDECECSAVNYCTSGPNSSGGPARMSLVGSTSVSANSFQLVAQPVPNDFGIFYYGSSQVDLAFGNGRRCVGGSTYRLLPTLASGNVLDYTYDLTAPPQASGSIASGSTWNFQAWFRDTAAGGAAFDLSDGLEVTFCP